MAQTGEKATVVAQEFIILHREATGQLIDEMRLYKMMYFAQRESLIKYDAPLFGANIEGWEFGPVVPSVRTKFNEMKKVRKGLEEQGKKMKPEQAFEMLINPKSKVSEQAKKLIHDTYIKYKDDNPMTLNARSQEEYSWIYATRDQGSGNKKKKKVMDLASIRIDAINEILNRKLGE